MRLPCVPVARDVMNPKHSRYNSPMSYALKEITSPLDPLAPEWLVLYELSFPANERLLAGKMLAILQHLPDAQHHCWAWVDDSGALAGIAFWQEHPVAEAAYLWYFAVQPGLRGLGLGSQFYQELAQAAHARYPLFMYEVEQPEEAATLAERRLRQRRIAFYARHGARRLGGVDYLQTVGSHQPLVPMLLGHARAELRPDQLFDAAQACFGQQVTQTGNLYWENDAA
jgi:GNAT superfamily N-acetyltransferase